LLVPLSPADVGGRVALRRDHKPRSRWPDRRLFCLIRFRSGLSLQERTMTIQTENLHIVTLRPLPEPAALAAALPRDEAISRTVADSRAAIRAILSGQDERLLVIAGPCSIHDTKAALDYAARLAELRRALGDRLEIVMRVYFEKPRTTVGWKGLINDPHLDGSDRIEDGLPMARRLLLDINRMGLPAATEFLDPILPQYLADLIAWGAIGARTT